MTVSFVRSNITCTRTTLRGNLHPAASRQAQPQQQQQQQQPQLPATPNEHRRPQPMRIRHPEEDPAEVAKTILEMRERREAATNNSNKPAPAPTPTRASPPVVTIVTSKSSSPGLSQEGSMANERLKNAESKISGLMQELEELKFFQEIEDEKPSRRASRGR